MRHILEELPLRTHVLTSATFNPDEVIQQIESQRHEGPDRECSEYQSKNNLVSLKIPCERRKVHSFDYSIHLLLLLDRYFFLLEADERGVKISDGKAAMQWAAFGLFEYTKWSWKRRKSA